MKVVEMRMIRWICGHTRLDKIRNKVIRGKIGVASIEDKIREAQLRWFRHMRRRSMDGPVRSCEKLTVRTIGGVKVGVRFCIGSE